MALVERARRTSRPGLVVYAHDALELPARLAAMAAEADGQVHGRGVDRDGAVPCQIDGGLKCFGHPIGASGLRMAYEMYLQLLGRAGERQLASPSLGLTHNLGGHPFRNVASVSVFGLHSA